MADPTFVMKMINIKGRRYTQVHERLKFFRLNYPDHDLNSEVFYFDGKQCLITYKISTGSPNSENYRVHASGNAHEVLTSKGVNSTSFVENCDTSALGRCLANFGIGIDEGYASADEVRAALTASGEKIDETEESASESSSDQAESASPQSDQSAGTPSSQSRAKRHRPKVGGQTDDEEIF